LITTTFDYQKLHAEAVRKKTNIVRVLFDGHIYKKISKLDFEASSRGHNNSMVQVSDNGLDHIDVRLKTQGVNERIGG
jgi:hypothetical protein